MFHKADFDSDLGIEISPCCGAAFFEAPVCSVCNQQFTGTFIINENGDCVCSNCMPLYDTNIDNNWIW